MVSIGFSPETDPAPSDRSPGGGSPRSFWRRIPVPRAGWSSRSSGGAVGFLREIAGGGRKAVLKGGKLS